MARQVQELCAVGIGRYREGSAERTQHVRFVAGAGVFECWLHGDSSMYRRGLLGTASPPIAGTWISRRYGPSAIVSGMKASSVIVDAGRPALSSYCDPRGKPKKTL